MPMHITVYGQPAPQGSKRVVPSGKPGGRVHVIESSKKVKPWRDDVKAAAEKAVADAGSPPAIAGPVVARMVFTIHRPASHYGTGRNAGTVKPTAAARPATKGTGDLSKLIRSTEDALSDAGVWVDDALVVELSRAAKVYVGEDPEALDRPGARIVVTEVTG